MQSPLPWYRQFWPWFLILLPATAVVASFASLYIALKNADTLVRDDWYRHGTEINTYLALQEEAGRRGIRAALALDATGRTLTAVVDGPQLDLPTLQLRLHHPTHAQRDIEIVLAATGPNRFSGAADRRLDGTWDAILVPAANDWTIQRRVWLTPAKAAELVPLRTAAETAS